MIRTYGLTHISLAVRDPEQSLRFYQQVFGYQAYFRDDETIHIQSSNSHDIITLRRDPATDGRSGGIAHFGFRLMDPKDIDQAVEEIERAGGTLISRGEFAPGVPYAYVADPDGYEIEIWFE